MLAKEYYRVPVEAEESPATESGGYWECRLIATGDDNTADPDM